MIFLGLLISYELIKVGAVSYSMKLLPLSGLVSP